MHIAVYLGSSSGNDPKYEKLTQQIACWLCEKGHTLVYGAGSRGLMGLLARTVHENHGRIIGVMPEFLLEIEHLYEHLDEVYMVKTMSSRKQKMIDLSQAFIALPGGPGTLEEITEIISLVRLEQIPGPCVLFNLNGYYDNLRKQLLTMISEGFLAKDHLKHVYFIETMDELESIFS